MADDRQKKRGKQPPEPEPEGGPGRSSGGVHPGAVDAASPAQPRATGGRGDCTRAGRRRRESRNLSDFRASRVADYRARQKKQLQKNKKEKKQEQGRPRGRTPTRIRARRGRKTPRRTTAAARASPGEQLDPDRPLRCPQGQGGTLPPVSGRVLGIAVASGGDRVYAATSNGGVWRSDDAGVSWRSLMDAWDLNPTTAASDSLSCGAYRDRPRNADRIFVGTGDGDEGLFLGVGPVVSFDGGTNWATEPVASGSPQLAGSAFFALAVDPGNTDRVVGATMQGLYRREPDGAGGFRWARKATPAGVDRHGRASPAREARRRSSPRP